MKLTTEERQRGSFSLKTIQAAVEEFKEQGYIVFEKVLPEDFLAELLAEYNKALNQKVQRFNLKKVDYYDERGEYHHNVSIDFRPEGGNHDLNRWNMHLPSRLPFLDPRVFANPFVLPVIKEILGADCIAYLLASDVPFPGAGFQSIHQDFATSSIALNMPLVDFTEENGPLELWPGTHRQDGAPYSIKPFWLPPERLKERIASPSKRMLIPAGSILIRDHRLIHRGTANYSNAPRPMLSIYYKKPQPEVPYRCADIAAKLALYVRRHARGKGGAIKDRSWLLAGNDLGRTLEDIYQSDRDYRRVISRTLWNSLPADAQHLLRYGRIEGESLMEVKQQRSWRKTFRLIKVARAMYERHIKAVK